MKYTLFITLILFAGLALTSCSSRKALTRKKQDSTEQLSQQLGFKVHKKDDLALYTEAAKWLGTPYKFGGTTKKGVDCSGLVNNVYKNAYQKPLERTVAGMESKNCRKVSRHEMAPGDLLFFNTSKNKKSVNHVGILLKHDYFIHASTSKGVIINRLSQDYYKKTWKKAGRVKK